MEVDLEDQAPNQCYLLQLLKEACLTLYHLIEDALNWSTDVACVRKAQKILIVCFCIG